MPKRPATPPPTDDEPKYLTVVHPYPSHARWEIESDCREFARWFSHCVDPKVFYTIFHKPSSPDMIIVEIRRDYAGFDKVLGEHKWSEFLRRPTPEQRSKATKVYYCQYSTGRQVQKTGWKSIEVQDAWFDKNIPNRPEIVVPYPKTHYCDVPPEDKINQPICRHLPNRAFNPVSLPKPQDPPRSSLVVGSNAWNNVKVKSGKKSGRGKASSSKSWGDQEKPLCDTIPNLSYHSDEESFPESPEQQFETAPVSVYISSSAVENENNASAEQSSSQLLVGSQDLGADGNESNEDDDLPNMKVLHLGSMDHVYRNTFEEAGPMEADPWEIGGSVRESVHRKANATAKLVIIPAKKEEPEIVCKTHGKLCTKKLCSDYDKQVKDMRRAKAFAQDRGGAFGARNGRGRGSAHRGSGRGKYGNKRSPSTSPTSY